MAQENARIGQFMAQEIVISWQFMAPEIPAILDLWLFLILRQCAAAILDSVCLAGVHPGVTIKMHTKDNRKIICDIHRWLCAGG
jgi:hypothetical protein